MAGRPRQSISLIVNKNKSHMTKKQIAERKESESILMNVCGKVDPPKILTPAERKEFKKISGELIALEIFGDLDVDTLVRYIQSKTQYNRMNESLKNMATSDEQYYKILRVRNIVFNECRACAQDLGLTLGARLKLVTPKQEEKKPSKFERWGG